MPDWKKQWPDLVYKIIMAILAIIFGYNQYHQNQLTSEHQQRIEDIYQYLSQDAFEADTGDHSDVLRSL